MTWHRGERLNEARCGSPGKKVGRSAPNRQPLPRQRKKPASWVKKTHQPNATYKGQTTTESAKHAFPAISRRGGTLAANNTPAQSRGAPPHWSRSASRMKPCSPDSPAGGPADPLKQYKSLPYPTIAGEARSNSGPRQILPSHPSAFFVQLEWRATKAGDQALRRDGPSTPQSLRGQKQVEPTEFQMFANPPPPSKFGWRSSASQTPPTEPPTGQPLRRNQGLSKSP